MSISEYPDVVTSFCRKLEPKLTSQSELELLTAVLALIITSLQKYPDSILETQQDKITTWQFKENGIFLPDSAYPVPTPKHFVPQVVFTRNSETYIENLSINLHPRMPIGSFGFDTVIWERNKEGIFVLNGHPVNNPSTAGKNALSGYISIETNLIK